MALLHMEGGKEEQMCPGAVAAPQGYVVALLAPSQDKPCETSPTVSRQSGPGAGRNCRLSAEPGPSGPGQRWGDSSHPG